MPRRAELADYLRSRRARLRPEDVGLHDDGRRRVPGLRREEVAKRAGLSVDYYVRLEQGRDGIHPSDSVLDAIARALQLGDDGRVHLHHLARPEEGPRPELLLPQEARPELRWLLRRLDRVPAMVLGRGLELLAFNPLASALHGGLEERRNLVALQFEEPALRRCCVDWERVAADSVAFLRLDVGRYPDDPRLQALVARLGERSEDFRRMWSAHDVREKTHGRKRFAHPDVGELTLAYETLRLPDAPDQALVAYTPEPGSPSETALELLATLLATERAPVR